MYCVMPTLQRTSTSCISFPCGRQQGAQYCRTIRSIPNLTPSSISCMKHYKGWATSTPSTVTISQAWYIVLHHHRRSDCRMLPVVRHDPPVQSPHGNTVAIAQDESFEMVGEIEKGHERLDTGAYMTNLIKHGAKAPSITCP